MKPFRYRLFRRRGGRFVYRIDSLVGLPMGLNSAFRPSGLVALPLMTSAQGILPAMAVYAGGSGGMGLRVYFHHALSLP